MNPDDAPQERSPRPEPRRTDPALTRRHDELARELPAGVPRWTPQDGDDS